MKILYKVLFVCFLLTGNYSFVQSKNIDQVYNYITFSSPSPLQATTNTNIYELLDSLYANGNEFYELGDYTSALPIYLKIDSIAEKNEILNDIIIKSILDRSEISRTTFTYDGVERAKELQMEALKKAQTIKSEELINNVYLRLADIYGMVDQLDSAKIFLDSAFNYYKQQEDVLKVYRAILIYMNYYYAIDKLDSAGIYLQDGISYLSGKNFPKELAIINYYYANYLEKYRNQYPEALEQFNKSQLMFKELGDTTNRYYWYLTEGIAYTYAGLGDYKSAFEYYQASFDVKRRLDKKSDNDLAISLETKYQAEKKEQEIELLNAQNQLAEEQKQSQLIILMIILLALLFIAISLFILYRNRQKITVKMRELDSTKSRFFANISHEFRTPLTLIKSPVENKISQIDLEPSERESLEMINRNTDRLLKLVDQLLDLSKLESGSASLSPELTDIKSFVKAIVSSFEFPARQKKINFQTTYKIGEEASVIDKEVLEKIVVNLLSNALKYTPEAGSIWFSLIGERNNIQIKVKNTGAGLSIIDKDKVFERFYQLDHQQEGAGIGLALIKELTSLQGGSISVESIKGEWTEFIVILPYLKLPTTMKKNNSGKPENHNDITPSEDRQLTIVNPLISEEEKTAELPILLITDDNVDMRILIKRLFEAKYKIIEAHDGQSGVEKAFEYIPDIIISDIMMPVMDGIQLCETLKKDERTSHIPIILLTAKAGEENELEGLETGADDFVLKPFSNKILKARVAALIDSRINLRNRYSQELILKPKDIALNTTDELFLQRVQEIMDSKLTNNDFSTEIFSREIGMSRMQLHRKLKALLGLSTSEFIKSQRMKIAVELLKKGRDNMSEIAYAVGFNDPSYFIKCFRETYNYTPKQFLESGKRKNIV